MNKEYSIEAIIDGCKRKKSEYQRTMVFRYSELLYGICIRYLRDKSEAQDVVQEAFVKIFKSIKKHDPSRGSFEGWIRKITVNECLRIIKKKRKHIVSLSELNPINLEIPSGVMAKMTKDEILEIVTQLPDGYREVFNLSVIEGYSHQEIGEMLGIKEASSRSNLSRARAILKEKLLTLQNKESWVQMI